MRSILLLVLLGGCAHDPFNPYEIPGTWRPLGANEQNLRIMAARPADVLGGVGDPGSDGQRAGHAVERLREGRVKPLPDSGVARLIPIASGGAGAGGSP
jgi:hypothetical protein